MQDQMPGRCMADGCRNGATFAFAILTPTQGFPIKLGSQSTKFFLTFYVCDVHEKSKAPKLDDVLPAARPIIERALQIKNSPLPADWSRASLVSVKITDADFIQFANGLRFRQKQLQRPRAANDR